MKQETLQLTGGNSKKDRRELDFYPTPPEVTHALMRFLKLPGRALIWEPACGNGAMSEVLKEYSYCVFSSDIETNYGTNFTDFLKPAFPPAYYAIITNPPFDLADKFILKALTYAPIVAMLLKSQYWHAKKRLPLFKQHPPAWILPLTWRPDFLAGTKGGAPTMEVIWTVWMKGDTLTRYWPLEKPVITV